MTFTLMRPPLSALILLALGWVMAGAARADVVTRLERPGKVVALTFDGCEGRGKPAFLDTAIVDVLKREQVPFTIFATGLFAKRNADALAALSASGTVKIENHSFSHPQHMERLGDADVAAQVTEADAEIERVTGRKPRFFRFPAGNYDARTLADVEALGHRVVHWRFASGDPTKGLSPEHLTEWVLSQTKPGDILIFHINGRAPATARALPAILAGLRAKGFGFVSLEQGVN